MPADDHEHRKLEEAVLRLEALAYETPLDHLRRIDREIREGAAKRPALTVIRGGRDDA